MKIFMEKFIFPNYSHRFYGLGRLHFFSDTFRGSKPAQMCSFLMNANLAEEMTPGSKIVSMADVFLIEILEDYEGRFS